MRRSSILVALVAALVGVLGGTLVTFAQDATPAAPAAEPIVVPAPNQCTVAPRDIAFFEELVRTSAAASPETASPVAGTPVGAGLEGEPADRSVRAAVLDTVRQDLACVNAGNYLSLLALYTDAYIANVVVTSGAPPAEALAALAAEPVPLEGDMAALLAILDVRVLADGRVAVLIDIFDPAASPPGPVRILYTMVEQDGRYLIDEEASEPIDASQVGSPAA